MTRTREQAKGRRESSWFFRVPTDVLRSPNYRSLSFKAKALLLDMGEQFNGHNNGDLCATWSMMRLQGWRSKDTLQRALAEAQAAGLIELTRQGGLHWPSLYAYTWLAIDPCGNKLDVSSTSVASGLWRRRAPGSTVQQATPKTGAE